MNIQDIKNFLENEQLLLQLKLNCEVPSNIKKNKPIFKEILDKYEWLENSSEILYLLKNKNNLENLHIFCPVCGKKNKFLTNSLGYRKHCSTRCSSLDPLVKNKLENTNKERWGYKHPAQSPIVKQKHIDTNMKRRGVPSPLNIKEIHKKGVDKAATKEIRDAVRKTKQERYNNPNYHNFEKAQETYFRKTGYKITFSNPNVREKSRKAFNKKYNSNSYFGSEEFQKMNHDPEYINKCLIKQYETKKKNKSFYTSSPEKRILIKLKSKFSDLNHIYYDKERYPFFCDFYIPILDLFIEYHGNWTHGKEPFNYNNLNHRKIIENWYKKSKELNVFGKKKDYYLSAIFSWAVADPLKLATFKKNNLNYKIFYTEEEFLKWFNNLV